MFFDASGERRPAAGFDAIVGNPPWAPARQLTRFSRDSGCYQLQGGGHANLYQLFAERMLTLAAPRRTGRDVDAGGPPGDHGCAAIRQRLFDRCEVDAVLGFDNRDGVVSHSSRRPLRPGHRDDRRPRPTSCLPGSASGIRRCSTTCPTRERFPARRICPYGCWSDSTVAGRAVPELKGRGRPPGAFAAAGCGPAARQPRRLVRALRPGAQRHRRQASFRGRRTADPGGQASRAVRRACRRVHAVHPAIGRGGGARSPRAASTARGSATAKSRRRATG